MRKLATIVAVLTCSRAGFTAAQAPTTPADRVIVVTLDGMRWQEVFGGGQRELMTREAGGVADTTGTVQRFWRESPEERRRILMPFLWDSIAGRGWLLGDSAAGREVRVTNGKWFSYPGYNELLSGAPDPRVDSNDKIPNPNVTVLEWINRQPGFEGRVAAFGSWDVLPFILNAERSGLPANGDGPPVSQPSTEVEQVMNALAADLPPYWGNVRFDAVTMQGALHWLRTRNPRVLYVMLGDTDEWAHERRYDLYLDAASKADRFLRTLWETVQSTPEYRGRTALLVATDHGRGTGAGWTDHGRRIPEAARIWMGGLFPSAPQHLSTSAPSTQSQFAATIAAALGLDAGFRAAMPGAAPPIESCCRP